MAWIVCLTVMAAFGLLCALWAVFGWLVPGGEEGIMICYGFPGVTESGFFRRYLFLRDLGLIGSPLIIVDRGLNETERRRLENSRTGIELCGADGLPHRLELERKRIDGTGTGDHSGRDQRRGISEL